MDERRKALYVATAGATLGAVLIALASLFAVVIVMALYLARMRRTSLGASAAALTGTGIGMTHVLLRLAQLI